MLKKEKLTGWTLDGPFQLIYPGVGNLDFLGKSATTPRLAVDHYSSKVYVYLMRSRKQTLQKNNFMKI